MKRTALSLCFGLFFLLSATNAHAIGSIVISSQVRGKECCDTGSDDALDRQLQALKQYNLTGTFSLRFDALDDQHTVERLKNFTFEKAAFLEITPSLAKAAGVRYRGPVDRWYKAGNAYLIGYDPNDRIRLVDAYMKRFNEVFGSYPQSTVAWMIDSQSLSYLSQKYGIVAHEITREQWGTDSYTLYGGPVNYPYYPSKNWTLIPAQSRENAVPVAVVRQTITDPIETYGDAQSASTSQPNDYLFGKKDLSYFKQLVDTTLEHTYPRGFGVIGLETSMDEKFQKEYEAQLGYIAELVRNNKAQNIQLKDVSPRFAQSDTSMMLYSSLNFRLPEVYWIQGSTYRARLILTQDTVMLTDLRVYSDTLKDPYLATASATSNAYWTVPFFFDGSRYFTPREKKTTVNSIVTKLTEERRDSSDFHVSENDITGRPLGMVLPRIDPQQLPTLETTPQQITLKYQSAKGSVSAVFTKNSFSFTLPTGETLQNTFSNSDIDKLIAQGILGLEKKEHDQSITFTPHLEENIDMATLISDYPQLFSPERSGGVIDFAHSDFIVVNRSALVGRNPIRLVIRVRDANGIATLPQSKPQMSSSDSKMHITLHEVETAQGELYVDLQSDVPTQSDISINLDGQTHLFGTVAFYPNCLKDKSACLKHPRYVIGFIRTKVDDVLRKFKSI